MFTANEWIMDSGAFTVLKTHGEYQTTVEEYAALIKKFSRCGDMVSAVSQDYMCEPFILGITRGTVASHQRMTIERYDALRSCDTGGIPIMPVLQGWEPSDYADHVRAYGDRLAEGRWVGVGSICKRQGDPAAIEAVLNAIKSERPDLRLHGFGVKLTALRTSVHDMFWSADSMAWSYAARKEGRDANSAEEAHRFVDSVNNAEYQRSLFSPGR